jgi:hypothetical protein
VGDESRLITTLIDCLESLHDLQLLLTMIEDPERWWDARAIAEHIGNPTVSTRQGLDRLAARNLLDIRVTEEVRFRYGPGTPELAAAGTAFLDAYRKNPLAIAGRVAARRPRSLRTFADAFRIRRDDNR